MMARGSLKQGDMRPFNSDQFWKIMPSTCLQLLQYFLAARINLMITEMITLLIQVFLEYKIIQGLTCKIDHFSNKGFDIMETIPIESDKKWRAPTKLPISCSAVFRISIACTQYLC